MPGMAKHSMSAFNESKAIRILERVLEEKNTIKTFFKENDRTPNYDGTFELVRKNGEPKKQFIVQIKKTDNLDKKKSGKNKGKYVYQMETLFLYYIKEKVAESPAIYFVVDIDNNRIFYLYLSVEVLMSLNFEGKTRVSYAFSDNDILKNVSDFYQEMDLIATKRNQKFIYKTEEEISNMQEAVEYLNSLLNSDFKIIKEHLFPKLWRFGIGTSKSPESKEFSLYNNDQTITYNMGRANMFCLYPQYKGKDSNDISEFRNDGLFQSFDFVGNQSEMDYVRENLSKIIKSFCQNPPIELLPISVKEEFAFNRASIIHSYFSNDKNTNAVDTKESCLELTLLLRYIDHIVFENPCSDNEQSLKKYIHSRRQLDLFNTLLWESVKVELVKFKNDHKLESQYRLHTDAILRLIGIEGVRYYVLINDLFQHNIKTIHKIWDFDFVKLMVSKDISKDTIKPICDKWFQNLPNLYSEFYNNIFEYNYKYKFARNIFYCINDKYNEFIPIPIRCKIFKSNTKDIHIHYDDTIDDNFSEEDKRNGIIQIINGDMFSASILKPIPTLYYDGIRCFLYQGICDVLNLKCDGIKIDSQSEKLFY